MPDGHETELDHDLDDDGPSWEVDDLDEHPHHDDVPLDETPEQAAAALWRRRRSNRIQEIDRLDALYKVYMTAIAGIVATLLLSSLIGDTDVSAAGLRRVADDGPAWLGVGAALALALGLRSGSRGGPLALEPAEVRLVLQAPLDRRAALLHHTWKLLRFGTFVSAVVGAVAGQLAVRRLGGAPLGWVASGLAYAILLMGLAFGAALSASGTRVTRTAATIAGAVVLGWAALDVAVGAWSPFRLLGGLALWPLDVHPVDLVGILLPVAALGFGLRVVGGVSMEAAERRTGLVSQLRFAVTVQDLRSVVLLRRQLAMDLPRSRPWIPLRGAARRLPVWRRDLRGLLRFPLSRVLRLALLGALAGLSLRGVWDGTTPLVVVAGIALYLAALDAAEPLAQEADQVDRADSFPIPRGDLLLRHLAAPVLVMVLVCLVGWAAVLATAPEQITLEVGAVVLVPIAVMAAAGAVVSVVSGIELPATSTTIDPQVMMPEMAGMRVVFRSGFPPLLTVLGTLTVVAAREAALDGRSAAVAAASIAGLLVVPAALVGAWVKFREPAKAWWQASLAQQRTPAGPAGPAGEGTA